MSGSGHALAQRLRRAFGHGIGLRVLMLILVFSSAVTAILTISQLYLDYRRDVGAIEGRLAEIEQTMVPSLAGNLWNVDVPQLRLMLEGLTRLPDLHFVEVREIDGGAVPPLVVSAGRRDDGPVIARAVPLVHDDRGTPRLIGHFHAEASLNAVYGRLVETAVVILVSQGIKTFLVSLFTLAIVYRLVARHLVAIAAYVERFSLKDPAPALVLNRTPPRRPDELDQVSAAINTMRLDLQSAYEQLRAANAELAGDIRRRDEQDREMRLLVERLTRTNRELERFAHVAAHDLQEPLRSVASYAQLIDKRYGDRLDAEGREFLGYMTGGAKHIKALIGGLERYTRIAGASAAVEAVDLGSACDRAIAALAEPISAAGAQVEVGELPVVAADPGLMSMLFENLIDNAVKFRRPGVAPRIRVEAAAAGETEWRVSVTDNGIGIAPTSQDVFELFRRLHPSDYPGTGEGLAICRRIVEHAGGRIWVERPAEGGTRLCFTLPMAAEQEPRPVASPALV